MHIAIFTDTFLPATNGIVTATVALANGLVKQGHRVTIIAPTQPAPKSGLERGVTIIKVGSISAGFYPGYRLALPYRSAIVSRLRKEKVDTIHFTTPSSLGLFAILAARKLRVPLIGTFHTFIAEREYLRHVRLDYTLFEKIAWSFTNAYYNRCDVVTVPAPSTRRTLMKHGCHRPITVISNGIDTRAFISKAPKKLLHRYADSIPVLYVGRVSNEKNILGLIRAFEMSVHAMPKLLLIVVGDGPQMQEACKLVRERNLQDVVIFTGRIDNEVLRRSGLFQACTVFATASTTENQPLTVLEAFSQSLPVIGCRAKGMIDLVRTGHNGVLVPPRDERAFSKAIIRVATDSAYRSRLARGAHLSAQAHTMDAVIAGWVVLCERLVRKRKNVSH